jgi:hypothetical protein
MLRQELGYAREKIAKIVEKEKRDPSWTRTAACWRTAMTLQEVVWRSKFENKFLHQSIAFWTTDSNLHDHGTMLLTTFVSSTQLTAVIPGLYCRILPRFRS